MGASTPQLFHFLIRLSLYYLFHKIKAFLYVYPYPVRRPEHLSYYSIDYNKKQNEAFMNFSEKIRWNIQRKSFSNRGFWKWLNQIIKNFDEISRTLNDR